MGAHVAIPGFLHGGWGFELRSSNMGAGDLNSGPQTWRLGIGTHVLKHGGWGLGLMSSNMEAGDFNSGPHACACGTHPSV